VELEPPDPPLTDGYVRLRPLARDDSPAFLAASRDSAITRNTNTPAFVEETEAQAWIAERTWRTEGPWRFAVTEPDADEAIGYIGLRVVDWNGQIGYWVRPEDRGRGVATRALRLLARWALETAGFERVQLLVEPENQPSRRVAENAGFRAEGLLRRYVDLGGRRVDGIMFGLLPEDLG
jgi:RimJ/RimL family protein N-acetyltransferase